MKLPLVTSLSALLFLVFLNEAEIRKDKWQNEEDDAEDKFIINDDKEKDNLKGEDKVHNQDT